MTNRQRVDEYIDFLNEIYAVQKANEDRVVALTRELHVSMVQAARHLGLRVDPPGSPQRPGTAIYFGDDDQNAIIYFVPVEMLDRATAMRDAL